MVRVIQLTDGAVRRVALVEEPYLHLLQDVESVYALALTAAAETTPLSSLVTARANGERLEYDAVYSGRSAWRILPPFDHPIEPARCLVSGTGLTHIGSARDRDAMHDQNDAAATDSMRMFQAGLAGGRPAAGCIGAAPEWFYKGTGATLRAHGEPLLVPPHAEGAGEEAEIAGVYIVDLAGRPRRVGMATGNEFSDHRFEKRNYLHLAGSKLLMCALGPELVIDPRFDSVPGEVWIERGETTVWRKRIASGEAEMSHSLQNLEHHHFKAKAHGRPGDVHVHFLGAHSLSFGEGITLADGDVMAIRFEGFGRALCNAIHVERAADQLVTVQPLG
ncbi:MAG: GguC protein [Luteitalea sp.]|nr:GguC protein [Luteitalea sp.]